MSASSVRIAIGSFLGFLSGFALSLINGKEILPAFISAVLFSVLVMIVLIVITWAAEMAERKGYNQWVGILLVLVLNILGILLLLLLPPLHKRSSE